VSPLIFVSGTAANADGATTMIAARVAAQTNPTRANQRMEIWQYLRHWGMGMV
jgi:hypothetical protein